MPALIGGFAIILFIIALWIFVLFSPRVLTPPGVDLPLIPELDTSTEALGLGLSILLGIIIIIGKNSSRKDDKHQLDL
jgi:hypothetical protein